MLQFQLRFNGWFMKEKTDVVDLILMIIHRINVCANRVDGAGQWILSEPFDWEFDDDDSGLPTGGAQLLLERIGGWPRRGHDLLDHHHRVQNVDDDVSETFDHHENRVDHPGVDDDGGVHSVHHVERHVPTDQSMAKIKPNKFNHVILRIHSISIFGSIGLHGSRRTVMDRAA